MEHMPLKKILIPVDFSKTSHKVFHHVKWLARQFGSEVTLMHINEDLLFSDTFPFLEEESLKDFNEKYESFSLAKLEALKTELLEAGIKNIDIQYAPGNVAQSISQYADENNMDLVAMGTHGVKGMTGFLLGSNAYKVVNSIDCPVLTVHEKSHYAPYLNIVAPLDDSLYSRAKFPYIAELATTFKASVEVVYPKLSDSGRVHVLTEYFSQVSAFLESKQVKHNGRELEGHFAHEVVKFAEYTNADLLVIMSDAETVVSHVLLGSQAHQIINSSKVPVITLHPDLKAEVTGNFF